MNAEVELLERSQTRIQELQREVAEQERANQSKAKELMKREQRIQEREALIEQREAVQQAQQHERRVAKQQRTSLIAPLLLITCIGAGYLAFEQISQQRAYFQQVKTAEAHVDKLTRVLSLTQARMVDSSSMVSASAKELASTHQKLENLEAELASLKAEPAREPSETRALIDILMQDQGAKREIVQSPSAVLK